MATLWQKTKGVMLDTLGNTLIPAFLNWVKRVWQHHPIDIHPETQALIDAGQPLVFMVWHDEMYTLLHKFWQTALLNIPHILISQSRDGDFMTAAAGKIGFPYTIRGAHGRGGAKAAMAILTHLRTPNQSLLCLVDGPRGPRHVVKEGIVQLAQKTNVPLIPVTGWVSTLAFCLNRSWDKFQIPWVFCRVKLCLGQPVYTPKSDGQSTEAAATMVTAAFAGFCEAVQATNPPTVRIIP
jgi:lysophospholipid acyltransferase (LPLAT)-like uncharacterized protein